MSGFLRNKCNAELDGAFLLLMIEESEALKEENFCAQMCDAEMLFLVPIWILPSKDPWIHDHDQGT